jgi:hypothetical protein
MSTPSDGMLTPIVDEVDRHAKAGDPISIDTIRQIAGQRAAGPLLLLPALMAMSPITVIPGLATLIGLNTVLVAGQMALGHEQIWLPGWLRRLHLAPTHAKRLVKFLKPVGKVADEVARPRLRFLTSWPLRRIGAAACTVIGLAMPLTEVIPFTATWVGALIATYALAITARDGLLVLAWVGLLIAAATIGASLLL